MIGELTRLNTAVSELLKAAKTPAQTAASEHFQIARDAFRQGLYPEALEEAGKAIEKYRLEWRFHSLVGTIRMGNVTGGFELIDIAKAEESFLLGARYARVDHAEDAARSFLAASWAAYCQGRMGPALAHAEEALRLHPRLGEALFQLGKIRMAIGETEAALSSLRTAIDVDKRYALKAAADGDYNRHEAELRDFIVALTEEKAREVRPVVQRALADYDFWSIRQSGEQDPLPIKKAREFLHSGLPLWDLLDSWQELTSLPKTLAEDSAGFLFFSAADG